MLASVSRNILQYLQAFLSSYKALAWFNRPGYLQGVFWVTMVSLTSSINDICMRFLGERLHAMEIVFFRFAFAAILVLPIMLHQGRSAFATARPVLHIIRAVLGFIAVSLWCYGVGLVPLAVVSTIALTVPIFVLPLAYLILHEQVGLHRTFATLACFSGILVIATSQNSATDTIVNSYVFGIVILVVSAILFALSDIMNKIMVKYEGMLAMLFYFAIGTSIAGLIPALMVWQTPTIHEFCILFCLGLGGNLILYCLLKAFSATQVSALAPYRYLELIFAAIFGLILFGEIPGISTISGIMIIIAATFYIAYKDGRKDS